MEFLTDAKTCSKCKQDKDRSEFYPHNKRLDGLQSQCKTCTTENVKRWKAKNPGSGRIYARNARRKRLGITGKAYGLLLEAQNGLCAICDGEANGRGSLHEDHDYQTGQVRGLLCSECNLGLGKFKDDPVLLSRALHYLRTHRDKIDEGLGKI